MKIVTVIPIAKGIGSDELTYYTSKDIEPGFLVEVPVRKRNIPALVLSVEHVQHLKALVRKADFQLKKTGKIISRHAFTPHFFEAVKKSSDYFASTAGAIIDTVSPTIALTHTPETIPLQKYTHGGFEGLLFQEEEGERFDRYKSLIREKFAKNESLLFVFPTRISATRGVERLSKGVEEFTYLLHGGLPKKELEAQWKGAIGDAHPTLLITTPGYLSLPRSDIGTIVVEEEHSRHYKKQTRPYVDTRKFTEFLAESIGVKYVLADTTLRVETLERHNTFEFSALTQIKRQYKSDVHVEIADMRTKEDDDALKKPFSMLGNELKELITYTQKTHDRIFCFVTRLGLGGQTLCQDCGQTVTCEQCSAPVVLHEKSKERVFVCHSCGKSRTALESCTKCDSWRLSTYGVGTENVADEIHTLFPEVPVTLISSNHTNTNKKAESATMQWLENGGVCIGTEMALPYVSKHLTHASVVSIDSLFTVPDFHIRESIFNIITTLRLHAKKSLIIQTRFPHERVLEKASTGSIADFQKEELAERKMLLYPPFSQFIKLQFEGLPEQNKVTESTLQNKFVDYDINIFPAFVETIRGKQTMRALITLKKDDWPNKKLLSLLRELPQYIQVNVDPIHTL
jgi:primosomal protein N' (replication factor Y)